MAGWLAPGDVVADLGDGVAADDPVLLRRIAAAERVVSLWRPDVDYADTATVVASDPDVYQAGVDFAALLFQSRVTPEGFAGFDAGGGVLVPVADQSKVWAIRRMCRANRPAVG